VPARGNVSPQNGAFVHMNVSSQISRRKTAVLSNLIGRRERNSKYWHDCLDWYRFADQFKTNVNHEKKRKGNRMALGLAPIAFTLTLTLISSQAFSQAIAIQSVNVEMTAQEFTSSLELSGHTCIASVFNDTSGAPTTNLVTCKRMNSGTPAEIKHSENLTSGSRQIYFDCGALNACGYSLEQVGQAILDSGFVSNLDPRDEFNPEFSFYWG
jgi:hypothetical protein